MTIKCISSPSEKECGIIAEMDGMKHIFDSYRPAIEHDNDALTGLPLFTLAAVGPNSDIESVYRLLKEHPAALMRLINARGEPKSRGGGEDDNEDETVMETSSKKRKRN